jgi:hypothetical protein
MLLWAKAALTAGAVVAAEAGAEARTAAAVILDPVFLVSAAC